jgi:hypothetical protein
LTRTCAVTLDLHHGDHPDDLREAHAFLSESGIPVTIFLPTGLLEDRSFGRALRAVDDGQIEIGTHGHRHDFAEIRALSSDVSASLAFLTDSVHSYSDFFGRTPSTFRSPCWCNLAPRALDALAMLGYCVDSSCTPQRLGLLSSFPAENPWLLSSRRPGFLRPTLLEIPTSTFVVPFSSGSLAAFRTWGALAFAAAFGVEAWLADHVVNLQLHVGDFLSRSRGSPQTRKFSPADLLPQAGHGFGIRHLLLDRDPARMNRRVRAVLRLFAQMRLEFKTLASIHDALVEPHQAHVFAS